jgi:glutamyl-tRNA synthetase
MNAEEIIRKAALENAIKFNGKASAGAVIGKVLAEVADAKSKMQELKPQIDKIIAEINNLSLEQQKEALFKINPDFEKEQKEKKKENKEKRLELPELKGAVEGKVITRIAPEPSKYYHVGHAVSFALNYMYGKKYSGKTILRFDDTNPEASKKDYVDGFYKDILEYLDIKVSKTIIASDNMQKYLEYAQKLIEDGHAYTSTQTSEEISADRRAMKDNAERGKSKEIVLDEWNKMLNGDFKEGCISLRLKISMQHKNAVMRDPVIFRIIHHEHYKQGTAYLVWPMYDFESAIEDAEVTHVLRSSEFESRIELHDYIRRLFNLPNPVVKQYARFNVTGAITQGREIRALIETGKYLGWDDPRLVTLKALTRRGILPEVYYELAKVIGMSKTSSEIDFSVISSISRRLLDISAKRFFFIEQPAEIHIENAPERILELDMHPRLDLGKRIFNVNKSYLLDKKDVLSFKKGEFVRLIDNLNFLYDIKSTYVSDSYQEFKEKGEKIIQFLPKEGNIEAEIRMPDTKIITGLAESTIASLNVGEVIQFQRFGFCRLDSIENKRYKFWYTHD